MTFAEKLLKQYKDKSMQELRLECCSHFTKYTRSDDGEYFTFKDDSYIFLHEDALK